MTDKPPPYGFQPGYADPPPPQQQQVNTVVVQQPVQQFRDFPVTLPDGNVTVLRYKTGMLTWIVAGVLCFFTGLCCIALIPFCIDALKDVEHVHPVTGQVVGVYTRL